MQAAFGLIDLATSGEVFLRYCGLPEAQQAIEDTVIDIAGNLQRAQLEGIARTQAGVPQTG